MSKKGITEDFFLSLSKQGQTRHPRKPPKSAKQKGIVFFQDKYGQKEKEEKAFGPCEERLVKDFCFIAMLFQHNSIPAFLEGKKLKSQIIAEELKLNKQNTDPHSQKIISVNFLCDPLNF